MAPWLFFLFIGTLDFGIFAYGSICTQSAARAAADSVAYTVHERIAQRSLWKRRVQCRSG